MRTTSSVPQHSGIIKRITAACDFAVQWQPDGKLMVLYAPMMEEKNPFFFATRHGYIDIISAADSITNDFFREVGNMYYEQFRSLPKRKKEKVSFPPVRFHVSVDCRVDIKAKMILSGDAVADGKAKGLDGRMKLFHTEKKLNKLWARVYRVDAVHTPKSPCLDGLEIQGHSDPNCEWSWGSCTCKGRPCCQHIVQPVFDNPQRLCYDEECAWGWLWLACGCHKKNVVPCPECKDKRMKTWKSQLKKVGMRPPKGF